AVVGGLDKILPAWENEARENRLHDEIIQVVLDGLRSYPGLEPSQRAEKLALLMERLEQAQESSTSTSQPAAENTPAPTGKQSNHSPSRDQPFEPDEPHPRPQTRQQRQQAQMDQPRTDPGVQSASENEEALASQPKRSGAKSLPAEEHGLNAPLRVLQGVGNRLSQTLSSLGLNTLEDLLFYFPRRYDDYSQLKPINRLEYGEETTVLGTIQSVFTRPIRGGKLQLTEAVVGDGTGFLRVTWFNQPWLSGRFSAGTQVVLAGKVDQYLGRPTMSNPEIEQIEQEHLHTNRIVPVYPLTSGLTQKNLRRILYQTISYWAPRMPDYIPEQVRSAVKLMPLSKALINIHFPESQDLLDAARWRLAFDEIFLLQLGVLRQKRTWQTAQAQVFATAPEWLEHQIGRIPFSLTGAQTRVIEEIRSDLNSGHPMDRLIQGDVGSGKTVVAAMAVLMVAQHGAQAAFMAPTSILAEQHYRSLTKLLAQPGESVDWPMRAEEIRLLIGDTPETEKEEIRQGLENGSIKLIIGTHALIESPVQFQRLQLAVIDEQHRFGVAQRSILRAKGENPHLLVMTATPIPRSLALTVYGDLDLSIMDEMPPGRQPVDTFVLPPLERERAYQLIRSQISAGSQAFIIYPLVEQNDEENELPKEGKGMLLSAVEECQRLQKNIFPNMKLGLLHGRLKPEEKDQVMKAFRSREYDILVSTTVVEVGVDIPNATVMLVEGANRFGLAQLHQLRGRVGRSNTQSFCLLIPDNEDAVENERLAVMSKTNDGFVLAEHDLQLRGPGEFLGTRQAGFSALKMANLTDVRLIEKARQHA
ncbi:MAG: ATP-dependent DNA helicase RecG, partial [Anaerolineaceae bacterium]|nr:ATP-dependent DNA helicase RecG [Anaerolineaceae bacterium]